MEIKNETFYCSPETIQFLKERAEDSIPIILPFLRSDMEAKIIYIRETVMSVMANKRIDFNFSIPESIFNTQFGVNITFVSSFALEISIGFYLSNDNNRKLVKDFISSQLEIKQGDKDKYTATFHKDTFKETLIDGLNFHSDSLENIFSDTIPKLLEFEEKWLQENIEKLKPEELPEKLRNTFLF